MTEPTNAGEGTTDPKTQTPPPQGDGQGEGQNQDPKGRAPDGQQAGQKSETPEGSEDWTAEQWREHALSLRKENAKRRVDNKDLVSKYNTLTEDFSKLKTGLQTLFGDGESDVPPEEIAEHLKLENEGYKTQLALSELAIESGLSGQDAKYFKFLVQEKLQELEEGDELGDDDVEEIAAMARSRSAPAKSSVSGSNGKNGQPPAPEGAGGGEGGQDETSLAEFKNMSLSQKSLLFQKNPDLYKKLMSEARGA